MFLTGVRLRSSAISALFSKSLRLSNDSRQKTTTGNIVNLMTVDAQRFADIMLQIHYIWASPLQVMIAMWFLWGYVGVSSLAAGHLTLVPALREALADVGRPDIMIVVGGVIPPGDFDELYAAGATAIFPPGTVIADAAVSLLHKLAERSGYELN